MFRKRKIKRLIRKLHKLEICLIIDAEVYRFYNRNKGFDVVNDYTGEVVAIIDSETHKDYIEKEFANKLMEVVKW